MFESLNSLLNTILLAIGIGFIPSIIWLLFWLREDAHPEPKRILIKAFCYGMLSVPFAIAFELWALNVTGYSDFIMLVSDAKNYGGEIFFMLIGVTILWAVIEEVMKFVFGSRELAQKEDNEPIDPVIYMVTAALGFAALENVLFIMSPLLSGELAQATMAAHQRFMGATLLHVLASGLIGLSIGYTFYRSRIVKIVAITLGACGAAALHAAFNIFIILYESRIFLIFAAMWVLVIAFIVAVERLKFIQKKP
jgi:protease PrsW